MTVSLRVVSGGSFGNKGPYDPTCHLVLILSAVLRFS